MNTAAINLTHEEIHELLGTVKVKQMRVEMSRLNAKTNEDHVKNVRKMRVLKTIQSKLEQAGLAL